MSDAGELLLSSCPGRPSGVELEASVALLARARAGEASALERLVQRHHEQLLRVVRVRLGKGMRRFLESCDVVQETYKALLVELPQLRLAGEGELVAWLARVATNRIRDAHDHAHAARRDPARAQPLEGADAASEERGPAPPADVTPPPEAAFRAELRGVLDGALADLPEEQREVILLRDYCGSSWEHIADQLGRPLHAAQQLHQRAWIRVRRKVEPRLRDAR